jgi:hypothetical protein
MKRKRQRSRDAEEGHRILASVPKKTKCIEAELFPRTITEYSLTGLNSEQWILAVQALQNARLAQEETERRIERMRRDAEEVLRTSTNEWNMDAAGWVRAQASELTDALCDGDIWRAVAFAFRLQLAYSEMVIQPREADAERGRETRDSVKKANDARWGPTREDREKRNAEWHKLNTRLTEQHPNWSKNNIAREIKKNTHAKETLRTILNELRKKSVNLHRKFTH